MSLVDADRVAAACEGGSPMRHTSVRRRRDRASRLATLVAIGALLLTACGSRLTEEEIAAYAGGSGQGGITALGTGAGSADGGGDADVGGVAAPFPGASDGAGGTDTSGGAAAVSGAGQADEDGATGSSGAGQAGDGGGAGDAGADQGAAGGEGGQPGGSDGSTDGAAADTRAAPPGGNGGATEVGVTEDRILIYNVADLTGAVPGLFRDAYEATLAYIQYFTATEGTVYGRQIVLESRDTQLSSQGNRAAYLDACENAFAGVGSMSAFEEGAAEPLKGCGMPDLRNVRTSKAVQQLDNVFGIQAVRTGEYSRAEWEYYKERFPEAVKNAGFVWLENQTTNYQVGIYIKGTTEQLGYQWKKQIQVAVAETNYARIVTELKDAGIELVGFQGAYQQAARLAESMQQQNYAPKVFALQQNNYTPDLIQTCGQACEPFVMVAMNASLLEEMSSSPELQLYAEWLARVNPRARPTGLGMYSWAAARLFVQALKDIGPEPTRAKLLAYLRGVDNYDANGLIPPQHVGTQEGIGCVVMLDIDGGQFTRVAPSQGYRCSAGRVEV